MSDGWRGCQAEEQRSVLSVHVSHEQQYGIESTTKTRSFVCIFESWPDTNIVIQQDEAPA